MADYDWFSKRVDAVEITVTFTVERNKSRDLGQYLSTDVARYLLLREIHKLDDVAFVSNVKVKELKKTTLVK